MRATLLCVGCILVVSVAACCSETRYGSFEWAAHDAWCRQPPSEFRTSGVPSVSQDQIAAVRESARLNANLLLADAAWRKLSAEELAEFVATPSAVSTTCIPVLMRGLAWREENAALEQENLIGESISVVWKDGAVVVTHTSSWTHPTHDVKMIMRREPVVALLPGEPSDVYVVPLTVVHSLRR